MAAGLSAQGRGVRIIDDWKQLRNGAARVSVSCYEDFVILQEVLRRTLKASFELDFEYLQALVP
jgi:hypothetical protein